MNSHPRLTPNILALFSQGRRLFYRRGETIIYAGDMPLGAYLLTEGYVKVYSITNKGEQNLHLIYKKGELFPVIWMFKDLVRNVYYEAMTPVTLQRCDRNRMIEEMKKDPNDTYGVLLQAVEQYYLYADRIDNLQYRTAYERVVYRLLFLAGRFGRKTDQGIMIHPPLTHQEIADSLHITRETASRNIERLERRGLVRYLHHRFTIPDVEKLQAEIGENASTNLWGMRPD